MSVQLAHKCLAEAHHFVIALPFGSKSEPPLPPPMGSEVSEFEHLFKSEEQTRAEVDRVEAQASFIRTNGAVHLYPIATVDLHPPSIINPGHAKQHHALEARPYARRYRLAGNAGWPQEMATVSATPLPPPDEAPAGGRAASGGRKSSTDSLMYPATVPIDRADRLKSAPHSSSHTGTATAQNVVLMNLFGPLT